MDGHLHRNPTTFLTLPKELRLDIYELIVGGSDNIEKNIRQQKPTSAHLRFIGTCRQIYLEAREFAFRKARFIVELRYMKGHREGPWPRFPKNYDLLQNPGPKPVMEQGPVDTRMLGPLERVLDAILSLHPALRQAIRHVILAISATASTNDYFDDDNRLIENCNAITMLIGALPGLSLIAVGVSPGWYCSWEYNGVEGETNTYCSLNTALHGLERIDPFCNYPFLGRRKTLAWQWFRDELKVNEPQANEQQRQLAESSSLGEARGHSNINVNEELENQVSDCLYWCLLNPRGEMVLETPAREFVKVCSPSQTFDCPLLPPGWKFLHRGNGHEVNFSMGMLDHSIPTKWRAL